MLFEANSPPSSCPYENRLKPFFALAALLCASTATAAELPVKQGKTIGLVMTKWQPAIYETAEGKEECPAGFAVQNRENWLKQFPTEEERAAVAKRFAYLGPNATSGVKTPTWFMLNRGPNGENILYSPTVVKDLIPFRSAENKTGYGLDLDGNRDGGATPKTCKHETFTSPDGEAGLDNQIARLYGCSKMWRKGGRFHNALLPERILNRFLIEISEVDDEKNDDHVVVTFYKGMDRIVLDADGKALPWLTQRVDQRYPQYVTRTQGKIVDGVLITEPGDMYQIMREIFHSTARHLRDARFKLKLTETGAEGLQGGYEDVHTWWSNFRTSFAYSVDSIGLWSPVSYYEAAHRLADGYPDPETGKCTAISAAYHMSFVRAYIVHPKADDPAVTDPAMKAVQFPIYGTAPTPERMPKAKAKSDIKGLVAPDPVPEGIGYRLTDSGPVFVDSAGMTLYLSLSSRACAFTNDPPGPDVPELVKLYYLHPVPACAQQWSPLIASANAKPVGAWTLIDRPEGGKQWAFEGHPVHRSYKDLLAGDVNGLERSESLLGNAITSGRWSVAVPKMNLPPLFMATQREGLGVMAVTIDGRSLYIFSASDERRSLDPATWRMVPAAAMAAPVGKWSIRAAPDKARVWAYDGRIVFTYTGDYEAGEVNGVKVQDAELLVLHPVPNAPRGIYVGRTLVGPSFVDSHGMTMYEFHCRLLTTGADGQADERYNCDSWNDDTLHREAFCPARDRCAEIIKPVDAPKDAKPQSGHWSVAVVPDPARYPLRWHPLKDNEQLPAGAIKSWVYKGRPLYTSTADRRPGDKWGELNSLGGAGSLWIVALAGVADSD
jgi:predicted lipoprotein with Yx(FWY)xxD motif